MEIVETPIFTKRICIIISDSEYRKLQWALVINPEAGDIVPGAKGLRKLRLVISGRGKRAGLRIIYYWHKQEERIYMLIPYKKSDQSNLTNEQMKVLVKYVKGGVL